MKKLFFLLIISSNCLFATWKDLRTKSPAIVTMSVTSVYAVMAGYKECKKTDKIKLKLCYGLLTAIAVGSVGLCGMISYFAIKQK